MRKNIIDNLTELHNEPHLVDLSIFTLFAECVNGELTIYPFQFEKDEGVVYCIQIDGDMYVGSSKSLASRIKAHHTEMINGKHFSPIMQRLYNEKKRFKVYIIMRCYGKRIERAEDFVTRLLTPSMNVRLPRGKYAEHNEIIWSVETDFDRRLKQDRRKRVMSAIVRCPECNKELELSIKLKNE